MKQLIIDKENPNGIIVEVENEVMPIIPYEELVEIYIREKYTVSEELAIQRQRDTKVTEFNEYFAYCEQCKQRAKGIGGTEE